jgi:hypothetical protein
MAATGFTFHPTIAFRSGLGPYKGQGFFWQIPYSTEQGIFTSEQGIVFEDQGILQGGSGELANRHTQDRGSANGVIARDTIALTTPIPPHPAAERLGAGSA